MSFFENVKVEGPVVDVSLEGSRLGSFWLDGEQPGAGLPVAEGNIVCDLAVVGAGFTGLWSALEAKLRNPELRVVVLDAQFPGWAASGRNGGFVDSTLTHGFDNGVAHFGEEEASLLDVAGLDNLDAIEAAVVRFGWDCDFWRNGCLEVAVNEFEVEGLRESADSVRRVFLDTAAVKTRINSESFIAGVFTPHDTAVVNPVKLVNSMLGTVLGLGVEVFNYSAVQNVVSDSSGVRLGLKNGSVLADKVVLATNVSPSLLKRFKLFTIPVYDYVLMTEPLSSEQLKSVGWVGREGVTDLANHFHYYRMTADNRILFGGYDAIYNFGGKTSWMFENRVDSHRKLAAHFFAVFPQLEGLKFSHRWAGAIDTSSRFTAFFGNAHKGRVVYAAGFTGEGVAASRFAAETMLDMLSGEKTWRTELKMVKSLPIPFPPEPFAYPFIQLTRAALKKADRNEGQRGVWLKFLDKLGVGFDS